MVRPNCERRPSGPASIVRARHHPSRLSPAHQLEHSRQSQAALAGERGGIQQRALVVTCARKADADLMAAEHRVLAPGWRVLLVEDLALPAAVLRGVGA